jgi:putative transposase
VLKVLGLSKKSWYYSQQRQSYEEKYIHLREPLLEIARDHPEYGYRRTTVELAEMGHPINRKVVANLHNYWGLCLMRRTKRPKKSAVRALLQEAGPLINLVARLEEIDDFGVLYTDFTVIRYQRGHARAQWIPIVDHKSKLVMGHALGESANTDLALDAWFMVRSSFRQLDLKIEGTIIHTDQDGVFTGHRWLRETVLKDRVRASFSEDGAKGNVYMESFFGRFKEENRSILWEQEDMHSLWEIVKCRTRYYNRERRHSALGYKSPIKYLNEKGKIPSRYASEK